MCEQCVPGAPSEIFECLGTRLSYTMNLCFQKRDHLLEVTEDQGLGTHLQTQEGGSPYSKTESLKIKGWGPIFKHKKGAVPTVKQR